MPGAGVAVEVGGAAAPTGRRWSAVLAGLVLLGCYVALSFLADDAGFLGTDTGGKAATVLVMSERGDFDPDVGYWAAAWDPEARVHGLYYTSVVGDRYLNVTSLPMVLAARPLWDVGGYRAALLLPMLGGVATAFAGRALARRIAGGDGWFTFWVVGLATPVTVYALDLWEHSIGLGLMAWGVVALSDAVFDRATWWRGLLAGAAFGLAAAMRTEAFVYVLVATAVSCVWVAVASPRRVVAAVVVGAAAVAGFVAAFGANLWLETLVVGQPIRAARASGAASSGLTGTDVRLREGLTTLFSPFPDSAAEAWFVGVVLCLALVVVAARAGRPASRPLVVGAAAVAGFVYLWRFGAGTGFVPGVVAATPFAAAGLALGWTTPRARHLLVVGLAAVPLVVGFQFSGGAVPQWGGRYLLVSGLLLAVVGMSLADRMGDPARLGFVVLSAAVTLFGVAWLVQRSHDVATTGVRLDARPEAVLISPNGFVPREFGATYGDRRWLAAGSADDLAFAVEVVDRAGLDSFAIVDVGALDEPRAFPGWEVTGVESAPFIAGEDFEVTSYSRKGS